MWCAHLRRNGGFLVFPAVPHPNVERNDPHVAAHNQGTGPFDRTYGHLAPDAEEYERGLLDAWDSSTEAYGHGADTAD